MIVIMLVGQPNLDRTFQRPSRLMESKALVKSMKAICNDPCFVSDISFEFAGQQRSCPWFLEMSRSHASFQVVCLLSTGASG